jgi:hypothetical protein
MTKRLGVFGASLVSCLLGISSLEAQQTQFLRVGVSVERNSFGLAATRSGPAALDSGTASKRPAHVLKGALIGAAVGAATGLVAAVIVNNRRSHMDYLDHSEDGLAYLYLPITGIGLGIILGSIVGFVWK